MSIVELLVAIGIGTLIVAAMALLFANNSRSRGETERASHNIENGRFALESLRNELFHAGYFAEFDPTGLPLPAAKPDPCNTTLGVAFRAAMALHVQGYDNIAASTLSCLTDVKAGTDAFVVRRASGCAVGTAGCTGLAAGAPAFQASSCSAPAELGSGAVANYYRLDTDLGNLTLHKRNCMPVPPGDVAEIRRYVLRIYYVANNDKAGDGVPTLKYRELSASAGVMAFGTPLSLVQGVEQLQVEYGLDTTGDGDADVYTAAPDLYLGCAAATCVGHWASVVSAKVFVLSRSIDASPGHNDTKSYVLGNKADGTANSFAASGDAYKRRVFQEVVRLQNPSGRRGSSP
jgi:type IV pilus assembly protein PilW